MSELIINSKLATAGPGHIELQKYPPKENYIKNSCFYWKLNPGPVNLYQEINSSSTGSRKQNMNIDNKFFMSIIHIELMINSLMINQLENMS